MDEVIKNSYLRAYESKNCDIRFTLLAKASNNGDTFSKEIIGCAKITDPLSVLIRNTKEKILELNESTENRTENKCSDNIPLELPAAAEEIKMVFKREGKEFKVTMTLQNFIENVNTNATEVYMHVIDQKYNIIINAPLVRNVQLPSVIYAKFPVEPVRFITFNMCRKSSNIFWFKSLDKEQWVKVGHELQYEVTENDVNHYLKFYCMPHSQFKMKGPSVEVISESKVECISEFPKCPFEERHSLTRRKLKGNEFRVVSYNILADRYVYINGIQFSYCSPKHLNIHYRKQLIVKELEGYKADIICLQEVDNSHYKAYYNVKLKEMGYKSFYHRKGNCIPEGLACAFDKSRFKVLESKHIVLKNEVERRKEFSGILNLLNSNRDVKKEFMTQNTSVQSTVLKNIKNNQVIIVANTHLYYHPDADHIRILQVFMATSYLNSLRNKLLREHDKVAVVFCGDFNSDYQKSLYSFMIKGTMNPDDPDCLKISPSGDANIHHRFLLKSASGTPKYTNYTAEYKGCLDYIFIEGNKLAVKQVVPVPSENMLQNYDGLPNEFFPSDHLALVVDLKFKNR